LGWRPAGCLAIGGPFYLRLPRNDSSVYSVPLTLYPETKCTSARAIDILETYGNERVWMNSACDWGMSDPLAVPKTALEMKKRGHLANAIEKVIFQNPKKFLRQSANFKLTT
jgi:predicted metal-dependent TIM-barrel fold hydrolase